MIIYRQRVTKYTFFDIQWFAKFTELQNKDIGSANMLRRWNSRRVMFCNTCSVIITVFSLLKNYLIIDSGSPHNQTPLYFYFVEPNRRLKS